MATETAPSTPIALCTCLGMKTRVEMAPPCRGDAIRHILGTFLAGHVTKVHHMAARATDRLQPRLQTRIRIQGFGRLIAGAAEILRPDQHDGHAVIDAGDLHAPDQIPGPAGGQQRPTA